MSTILLDPDVLKDICGRIDILEYARSQGIVFKQRGGDWWCSCPRHTDKTPSLRIKDSDHTNYHCFSCRSGGDAIQFFRDMEGLGFYEAVDKASRLANVDIGAASQSSVVSFMKQAAKARKQYIESEKQDIQPHKEIKEDESLSHLIYGDVPMWREEGISQEVLNLFGVGIDPKRNRISYPIRDENGRLINIKSRTLYKNYKEMRIPKYSNRYPIGVLTYFEGLDITLPYVQEEDEIILFESIKSVMKCFTWGVKNTAAVGGHGLTNEQLKLLLRLKVRSVVIAFDNDVIIGQDKTLWKTLKKLSIFTKVSVIKDHMRVLGEKDSPADCGEEVFRDLYNKRSRLV